jgi:hypothetical protein
MPAGAADWSEVRRLYESGLSAPAIEKQIERAVSRQAILKRARKEGWLQGVGTSQAVVAALGSTEPTVRAVSELLEPKELADSFAPVLADKLKALGKDLASPQRVGRALASYAIGGTHKMAAALGGFSVETWTLWRKDCPELEDAITELQAAQAGRHLQRIDKAGARGDWKADEALLKANALTKDDWRGEQKGSGGVTIQIAFGANMPADAMKVTGYE